MKNPFRICRNLLIVSVFLFISGIFVSAQTESIIEVGKFSAQQPGGDLPSGWKTLILNKKNKPTVYTLVKDEDAVVVKAEANAAASGMYREIKIDPAKYPIIRWQWKVNNILKKSDIHHRAGDDYPARIYIDFSDGQTSGFAGKIFSVRQFFSDNTVINYLWGSKEPVGTIAPAFFSRHVMMIVVESGAEKLNQWVAEERNIYEDYKKAFGQEPPMISGVAILTDTDNTGESAVSYYGDISFATGEKN